MVVASGFCTLRSMRKSITGNLLNEKIISQCRRTECYTKDGREQVKQCPSCKAQTEQRHAEFVRDMKARTEAENLI
jgi:hypothetical protein